jgi:hypothetical protein
MPNLLETIQQNRATLASQQQGVGDQTQQIQTLLNAKTGKAPTSSDTGISNLGEQSAAATANQGQAQLGQQAAVQTQAENTQAAGIQQETGNQLRSVDQTRKFDTLQNRLQTQSVLNNLSQQKGDLSDQKSRASLEQVAFNLSMQDRRYVDTLQTIGTRRRLDNETNFKSEMQQVAFGDSLSMLNGKLAQGDLLSASDRDFAKALSDMSIADALKVAQIQAAGAQSSADVQNAIAISQGKVAAGQANTAAMYGGLGTATTGAITGYDAYDKAQARKAKANGEPVDDGEEVAGDSNVDTSGVA